MERIIIFGAGNCGRLIAKNLREQHKHIVCFIDNDPHKEGQSVALDSANISGGGEYTHLSSYKDYESSI